MKKGSSSSAPLCEVLITTLGHDHLLAAQGIGISSTAAQVWSAGHTSGLVDAVGGCWCSLGSTVMS